MGTVAFASNVCIVKFSHGIGLTKVLYGQRANGAIVIPSGVKLDEQIRFDPVETNTSDKVASPLWDRRAIKRRKVHNSTSLFHRHGFGLRCDAHRDRNSGYISRVKFGHISIPASLPSALSQWGTLQTSLFGFLAP